VRRVRLAFVGSSTRVHPYNVPGYFDVSGRCTRKVGRWAEKSHNEDRLGEGETLLRGGLMVVDRQRPLSILQAWRAYGLR